MASKGPVAMTTPKPQAPLQDNQIPLLRAETPSMSGGDFSSYNRAVAPLSGSSIQQLTEALAVAIQTGNIHKAQEMAVALAQSRAPVDIVFDADAHNRKAKEQEISVTVHVEDRESAGLILSDVKVRPSDTIIQLKRSFLVKYGFPAEVQKWIIGNRICGDDETLGKCQVTASGHTLYLYLLSARNANIGGHKNQGHGTQGRTPKSAENSVRQRASSGYETMNPPTAAQPLIFTPNAGPSQDYVLMPPQGQGQGQGQPAGVAARQQSQMSTHSSSSSLAPTSFGLSDFRPTLDPGSGSGPGSGQRGGGGRGSGGEAGEMMQFEEHDEEEPQAQGWQCEHCTLINQPTRPGCEACGNQRPASYKVPSNYVVSEEERQRLEHERQLEAIMQQQEYREREHNYQELLEADSSDLVTNVTTFTCPICFEDTGPGEGIVLRECLHVFCKTCLSEAVRLAEEAELKCPFQNDDYTCDANLQDREVRALVPDQIYERFLRRSLDIAESQTANSYHCKTADCRGWCIYEDLVNFFRCPVCKHENCLTCRAIHEGMNCKQYQEDLRIRAANDVAAQQTQVMLQSMVEQGEAMPCPQCAVIVQKKDGCDWIRCSICKTEICWVTKGPRWGPEGQGDLSGGCRCRVGGKRCHPNCSNCH